MESPKRNFTHKLPASNIIGTAKVLKLCDTAKRFRAFLFLFSLFFRNFASGKRGGKRTMARDPRYIALINSPKWRSIRRHKLSTQPLCERCAERGEVREATEVHHITPIETARSADTMRLLAYDPHNLRSLCRDCHTLTHRELRSRGKIATAQRNKDALARFRSMFLADGETADTESGKAGKIGEREIEEDGGRRDTR